MMVNVALANKKLSFPAMCVCCASPSQTHLVTRTSISDGRVREHYSWNLPYCNACAAHTRLGEAARSGPFYYLTIAFLLLTIGLGIFILWPLDRFVLAPMRKANARAACKPGCAHDVIVPYKIGSFRKPNNQWLRSHSFDFASPTFAAAFVGANRAAIVEPSTEVQNLLAARS
jgi:hypothetical protein